MRCAHQQLCLFCPALILTPCFTAFFRWHGIRRNSLHFFSCLSAIHEPAILPGATAKGYISSQNGQDVYGKANRAEQPIGNSSSQPYENG